MEGTENNLEKGNKIMNASHIVKEGWLTAIKLERAGVVAGVAHRDSQERIAYMRQLEAQKIRANRKSRQDHQNNILAFGTRAWYEYLYEEPV